MNMRVIDFDVVMDEFGNGAKDEYFFKRYGLHQSRSRHDVSNMIRSVFGDKAYGNLMHRRINALKLLSVRKQEHFERYDPQNVEPMFDICYDGGDRYEVYDRYFSNNK